MVQPAQQTRDRIADLAREMLELRARVAALEARLAEVDPSPATPLRSAPGDARATPVPTAEDRRLLVPLDLDQATPLRAVAEAQSPATPAPACAVDAEPAVVVGESPAVPTPARPAPAADVSGLFGRTLVVLGGGFLLRSLTDSGVVPALAGVAAGLLYAAFWLWRCERAAATGQRLAASLLGSAAVLIALPLLAETTLRFRLMAPALAAVLLWGSFVAALAVARRHRLIELSWLSTLGACATAFVLLVGSRDLVPLVLALLGMGMVLEARAFDAPWSALRWPVALTADAAVLVLLLVALRHDGLPEGYVAISRAAIATLGLALAALHVASAALRTLLRGRLVGSFEIAQGAIALLLGFGVAVRALGAAGALLVGGTALLLALACYVAAFALIDRGAGPARNFYAYATLAGLLALLAAPLLFAGLGLSLAYGGLALLAAQLGVRFDRGTLRFHALVYLLAAAASSGLLLGTVHVLFSDQAPGTGPATAAAGLTLTVVMAAYLVLSSARGDGSAARQAPMLLAAGLLVWGLAGLLAWALAAPVPVTAAGTLDLGLTAAAGSAALAALAILLAWISRRTGRGELAGLVYPLMALGGVKLLVQDLPHGRPLTLSLALVCFGGALIALPRLLARDD